MQKEYVEFFSAMLTPMLGLLMAYIAWQQWRTNNLKVKHDLYERRLAVYLAANEFLAAILSHSHATDEQMRTFLQKTRKSCFLFDGDLANYLTSLYKKAVDLDFQNTMLHDGASSLPVGEERTRLAKEHGELCKWFGHQFDVVKDKFTPFMRMS